MLNAQAPAPRYPAEELLGIMPADIKTPVDMREVIARIVDDSDFLEFKANYGPATLCGYAKLMGVSIGIISNLGPIDTAGATKATHFIQSCCQTKTPIIYLQNTTGYMVGKEAEQGGIIKHGSKMIQAVSNATVPQITLLCGASLVQVTMACAAGRLVHVSCLHGPTAKLRSWVQNKQRAPWPP